MSYDVNELLYLLRGMDIVQLREASRVLRQVYNDKQKSTVFEKDLRVGQRVSFTTPTRGRMSGDITKINTKTVEVLVPGDSLHIPCRWKVSPSSIEVGLDD